MIVDIRALVVFWGKALLLFSVALWPPALIASYYATGNQGIFLSLGAAGMLVGVIMVMFGRNYNHRVSSQQGVIEVFLLWHVLGFFAAMPFWYSGAFGNLIDCIYEAISGITTTGIELADLAKWTPDLLFYHQELQLMGGLGIIVFVLAIFPERFQSASQLFNVDITGPHDSKRVLARVGSTSRFYSLLYVLLTLGCIIGFYACGLDWFSSICEAFGITSTGGFSIHPEGLMFYEQEEIFYVATIFMLLGSVGFKCHYIVFIKRVYGYYWKEQESMYYLLMTLAMVVAMFLWSQAQEVSTSFMALVMNVVALFSTTGTLADISELSPTWLYLLTILGAVGGCSGSTSGGIKIARLYYIIAQVKRGLYHFINRKQVTGYDDPDSINLSLQGFGALLFVTYVFFSWLLLVSGLELSQAMQLTYSSVSCVGAMLMTPVDVGALSKFSKWLSMEAMIAGRMELIAFWVIFTPRFWRK